MQTYFDQVDSALIGDLAVGFPPDLLAILATTAGYRPRATTFALASIRAWGNWMLVNGQWHKRG